MPTVTCAECGADLDAVPGADPCPACGKRHRALAVPPAAVTLIAGEVGVVVNSALAELGAMPAAQARAVLEQAKKIIELQGAVMGRSSITGTLTVTRLATATATATASPFIAAVVVSDAYDAEFVPALPEQATVLRALLTFEASDVRDIRNKIIAGILQTALAVKLLSQPGHEPKVNAHEQCDPPNRVEQHDGRRAPEPPPPPKFPGTLKT